MIVCNFSLPAGRFLRSLLFCNYGLDLPKSAIKITTTTTTTTTTTNYYFQNMVLPSLGRGGSALAPTNSTVQGCPSGCCKLKKGETRALGNQTKTNWLATAQVTRQVHNRVSFYASGQNRVYPLPLPLWMKSGTFLSTVTSNEFIVWFRPVAKIGSTRLWPKSGTFLILVTPNEVTVFFRPVAKIRYTRCLCGQNRVPFYPQ